MDCAMIGTMDGDSCESSGDHVSQTWCVNCLNMWVSTIGERLTTKNAILSNLVVTVHELTHMLSEKEWCNPYWDWIICDKVIGGELDDIWGDIVYDNVIIEKWPNGSIHTYKPSDVNIRKV